MTNFVDIRMIVLQPQFSKEADEKFKETFKIWMIAENKNWRNGESGFLDAFGTFFAVDPVSKTKRGLIKLTFLKGNKEGPPSNEDIKDFIKASNDPHYKEPEYKAAAGANADFAWIAYWESINKNNDTWVAIKTKVDMDWEEKGKEMEGFNFKWWRVFFAQCHKRVLGGALDAYIPTRPEHGPPYDYLGGVPRLTYPHYGRGAGCLVEGFNVIYDAEIKNNVWTATIRG